MQELFSAMLRAVYVDAFKPAGWKKQGANFRLLGDDGLGKIVNFQRSRWDTADRVELYVNYGLYIEAGDRIVNRSFKEYECQLRERAACAHRGYLLVTGMTVDEAIAQIMPAVAAARSFLDAVRTKEQLVQMLLDGSAQNRTSLRVMHYDTCRLLCEMGYGREIYDTVRATGGKLFDDLAHQIEAELSAAQ